MKIGEVTIQFSSDELTLRPTPYALRTVLTELGGARQIYTKLWNLEYDAIFKLIKAGVHDPKKPINDAILEAEIFKYGISDLVEPCTEYLNLLLNGGKPSVETKAEDKETGNE